MFRLAHISDLHLGPLPEIMWHQLISKRVTGYINWHRHRKAFHQPAMLDKVMSELRQFEPDHLAITGDLVNIATPQEIDAAKHWLQANCEPQHTSLVPGNHDAYVPGAFKKAVKAWQPWICEQSVKNSDPFPYMKEVGPVAIIGFSTSNATLPFRATGTFTKKQAVIGGKFLEQAKSKGLFRTILIHHPPYLNATNAMKRMFGIDRFQQMIADSGAELILHGHTHLNTSHKVETPHGAAHIIGISSASQAAGDKKPVAGFNMFEIEQSTHGWECIHKRYAVQSPSVAADFIDENKLF